MVIGLLIGGVLKGQELIENAKIVRITKDLHDIDAAVMIFRSTYNAMPGDIRHPSRRLPNCATAPCNNNTDVGNGLFQAGIKRINFWIHMERAGLMSGLNEPTVVNTTNLYHIRPAPSLDLYYNLYGVSMAHRTGGATAQNPILNRIFIRDDKQTVAALDNQMQSCRYMSSIDSKFDDGKPHSGSVRILFYPTIADAGTGCVNTVEDEEYLTNDQGRDHFTVLLQSLN